MDVTSLPSFAVNQNSSPAILRAIPQNTYTFPSKKSILSPKPSAEVIAEVFPEKELVFVIFTQAVDSKPRTKEDIIGFSDGDEDDEQSYTDESVEGLADRFNQLFKEFMRQGKHEHRNELVG